MSNFFHENYANYKSNSQTVTQYGDIYKSYFPYRERSTIFKVGKYQNHKHATSLTGTFHVTVNPGSKKIDRPVFSSRYYKKGALDTSRREKANKPYELSHYNIKLGKTKIKTIDMEKIEELAKGDAEKYQAEKEKKEAEKKKKKEEEAEKKKKEDEAQKKKEEAEENAYKQEIEDRKKAKEEEDLKKLKEKEEIEKKLIEEGGAIELDN
eukprot:Mrub_10908.p2 GENE.Mrub_10908~~Mrub_10908.p2  ORF type:complete len:209 (+),score=55.95 Mrub_10908:1-627(+)